jgi:hypothetical protein
MLPVPGYLKMTVMIGGDSGPRARSPRPSLYGLENKAGVHEAYLAPQQEQSEMVAGTF